MSERRGSSPKVMSKIVAFPRIPGRKVDYSGKVYGKKMYAAIDPLERKLSLGACIKSIPWGLMP